MSALKGIKIAVLLADGFEQVEMVKPREALQNEGADDIPEFNKAIFKH